MTKKERQAEFEYAAKIIGDIPDGGSSIFESIEDYIEKLRERGGEVNEQRADELESVIEEITELLRTAANDGYTAIQTLMEAGNFAPKGGAAWVG